MNLTEKTHREQTSGYQWIQRIWDNIRIGEWETQTIGGKIDSKMYQTTGRIQPIFCNCKWKVTIWNFIKKLKAF